MEPQLHVAGSVAHGPTCAVFRGWSVNSKPHFAGDSGLEQTPIGRSNTLAVSDLKNSPGQKPRLFDATSRVCKCSVIGLSRRWDPQIVMDARGAKAACWVLLESLLLHHESTLTVECRTV
ncbi:hypothetical protein J7T55_010070 [Diaporthe amygdali]|uniref:uncharacterized protein n=1 Tax=Phomopsis amygdali TaxID=1214568 RepID=UPI0022FE5A5F|nr:uncharacterized protein J7T55_010070 [Diaporthe amygdali]KAJ0113826.1 hypothetical protein J7T55_010070 [Diaporthe amygdali]